MIAAGVNDVIFRISGQSMIADAKSIIANAPADIPIVFVTVPPFGAHRNWTAAIQAEADLYSDWVVANTIHWDWRTCLDTDGDGALDPAVDSGDGLHPVFIESSEYIGGCFDERFLDSTRSTFSRVSSHCLLYTSPSPRDLSTSRMPSSA